MDLLQNGIVTIVVLSALTVLVRRVVGFVRPSAGEPVCKSCASGHVRRSSSGGGASTCPTAQQPTAGAHPVMLYRPGAR